MVNIDPIRRAEIDGEKVASPRHRTRHRHIARARCQRCGAQRDTTANFGFKPAETISELSTFANVALGEVLLTGTPSGCATAVFRLQDRSIDARRFSSVDPKISAANVISQWACNERDQVGNFFGPPEPAHLRM